jgi:hypothetical protein
VQLGPSAREVSIGLATRHRSSIASIRTPRHVSDLSVKHWRIRSGVVDIGHAQQAQQPALEPA